MRKLLLTITICTLPIIGYAHGCIKGAAVGGIVGHVAGHHAAAGAAMGCVIGHHRAKMKERDAAQNVVHPQAGSAKSTSGTPAS
jgi:outer membrane lipoprotein SlyB